MAHNSQLPPDGLNHTNIEKVLEGMATQMFLMQRTIKTMAEELIELRKISLEIKDGQSQIVTVIGLKDTSISSSSLPIDNPESVPLLRCDLTGNSTPAGFNSVHTVSTAPETPGSAVLCKPKKKLIEYPSIEIVRILERHPPFPVKKALQFIRKLPNWKQEFLNNANLLCLMNAAKEQKCHYEKDMFVSFLSEQSKGIDLSTNNTWQYRMEIIMDALCHNFRSITSETYKVPIHKYVALWKNKKLSNSGDVRVIHDGIFKLFAEELKNVPDIKSPNPSLHCVSEGIHILTSISESKEGFDTHYDYVEILLKLMDGIDDRTFLVATWTLLRNIAACSQPFLRMNGLFTFERDYNAHKNNSNCELLISMFGTLGNSLNYYWHDKSIWKPSYLTIVKEVLDTQNTTLKALAAKSLVGLIRIDLKPILNATEHDEVSQLLLERIPKWTYGVPLIEEHCWLDQIIRVIAQGPASQLYSAWYITNLLSINEEKYLSMLKKANFEKDLKNVFHYKETDAFTSNLALEILKKMEVDL